jgi:hypothetical protein
VLKPGERLRRQVVERADAQLEVFALRENHVVRPLTLSGGGRVWIAGETADLQELWTERR